MAIENKLLKAFAGIATWIISILAALVFAMQGWAKFFSNAHWAAVFAHWGYPVWFRILIGMAECVAAILILIPRVAAYGAALVIAIMIGAIVTQLCIGDPHQIVAPAAWIVIAAIILFVRRRAALR